MAETDTRKQAEPHAKAPVWLVVLLGLALLLAAGALLWSSLLMARLARAENALAAAQQERTQLAQSQEAANARQRATTDTLAQAVGLTQRQVEIKTQNIMAAESAQAAAVRATNAQAARLAAQQQTAQVQLGAVTTDVSQVKTDVSGAKSSIAETQQNLAQTNAQMQRTLGDMGQMSGLIARNHDELEQLKHKGDRSYVEFTLTKGAKPTLLSTIKLQARRVDEKHSRYTLVVSADDRNIEKKDRSVDEPVQFYTGKDRELYEIVINDITRNTISGYLSTPRGAVQTLSTPLN